MHEPHKNAHTTAQNLHLFPLPLGAPQVAAGKSGDCTFEVDECGWSNPGPRERLEEMDWVRTVAADNRAPTRDHTIGTTQGK